MSFLSFENIIREYKVGNTSVKALDNVNFTIEEGEFVVILGPSGSGKSTALNLLGGMDKPSSGKITVNNKTISGFSNKELSNYRREDVGFVFQFYNLIPSLNAYENVDISSKLGKSPLDAKEIIRSVGLESRMKHFPSEMSGGELQRISIARAICKNPKILLCDEPTGALDSETGKMVLVLLQNMAKNYKKTVIVVTHNAAIAPAANRVIHLKDGRVINNEKILEPLDMEKVVW